VHFFKQTTENLQLIFPNVLTRLLYTENECLHQTLAIRVFQNKKYIISQCMLASWGTTIFSGEMECKLPHEGKDLWTNKEAAYSYVSAT
jgi:hypothetical protein